MITDKFKSLMADHLVSILTNGRVGQGGNSTSPSATDLDVDIGASDSDYTTSAVKSGENTVEYSLKIAGSNTNINGKSIREAAFFDASDNMLARLSFDAIGPIANTSDLEIFFILEME